MAYMLHHTPISCKPAIANCLKYIKITLAYFDIRAFGDSVVAKCSYKLTFVSKLYCWNQNHNFRYKD